MTAGSGNDVSGDARVAAFRRRGYTVGVRLVAIAFGGFCGIAVACHGTVEMAAAPAPAPSGSTSPNQEDSGTPDAAVEPEAGVLNDLSIIVEPSDSGAALTTAIGEAKKSIHMTMYELSASDIIDALLERHDAGVDVKVILNQQFPTGTENPNTYAFNRLTADNIPVVWASSAFTYTHEKCVVLDGTTAWVMTMNAAYASQVDNREYLAPDKDADAVAEAEAQFAADFAATPYTPSGPLLMSPVTMRPGLESLVKSATTTLDFEVEEMDDYAFVSDLCAAVTRRVVVRGLLSNATLSTDGKGALAKLKSCGVTMRMLATPYIHAKAIVVDGVRAYVGSANFSTTSLDSNRELGLITTNTTAIATVQTTLSMDIANGQAL